MLWVKGKYKHHVRQSFIDLLYVGFSTFVTVDWNWLFVAIPVINVYGRKFSIEGNDLHVQL